jgi:glutamine synthetase
MSPPAASFPPLHHIEQIETASLVDLSLLIQSFPVIDNHAHNLLREDNAYGGSEFPFESITSEAQGSALTDHVHTSLSHIRGMKQLAELYGCSEAVRDIKAARYEWIRRDYDGLIKKCLEGTHAIMMDDGLNKDMVNPFKWHRQFVPQVSRIVRVEAIAAEVLEQLVVVAGLMRPGTDADWERNQTEAFFIRFNGEFRNQIRAFANDPDVRGFKSVICYRTGLDIGLASRKALRPQHSLTESDLLTAFHEYLQQAVRNNNYRIQRKAFNDYLVVAVCDVLDKRARSEGESLPFQFHTGLGDTDINLVTANPAYMQPLIEAFPNVDFVLLHSSYPYTREAGYLASAYPNAWLDVGEVFPMLSRDGQESVLKQALELAPASKVLWSTDGHFFPETYWLANKQFRDVLEKILSEGVMVGDYTIPQAITVAADFMFWNSNLLYKLGEERKHPHLIHACGRHSPDASMRTLVNHSSNAESLNTSARKTSPQSPRSPPKRNPSRPGPGPAATSPTPTTSSDSSAQQSDTDLLDSFLLKNPAVRYVWLQWLDYTATMRVRMVPIGEFRKQLINSTYVGITKGLVRMLPNDTIAPGGSATGQFLLKPDLTTLFLNRAIPSPSATVQTFWLEDGTTDTHLEGCPRWALQKTISTLKSDFNVSILMGCEIEIVFMRPILDSETNTYTDFLPLATNHAWSAMSFQQLDTLPVIEEIVATLAEVGIEVPQFHSEAALGQWEFPLPAAEPLKAIDMLYKARDVIRNVVRKHGLKATLYPRPYDYTCGNANHTHFSLNGPQGTVEKYSDSFVAGLLDHLPSVLALTLPLEESYDRVKPGIWAGGEYVCWGTQNRECPLRKCGDAHWEFKAVDGIANMYLGMAALLASGIDGIRRKAVLKQKDCAGDPSSLSPEEREELGIVRALPRSLKESLRELERDEVLKRALGERFVANYLAVKRAEMEFLGGMAEERRRVWLIERY